MKNKYIKRNMSIAEVTTEDLAFGVHSKVEDNHFKYKLLIVSENNLVAELEGQYKLGFELCNIIEKISPNAQSDFVGYKILLTRRADK